MALLIVLLSLCLILQGLKLYFRVLEAMVRSESERKGRLSLTDLLTSKSFHTCLLACSFEVVSAAYHMVRVWPSHYETLLHFDMRFASALVVIPNFMVPHSLFNPIRSCLATPILPGAGLLQWL